jgi:hypothetical protein
MLIGANPGNRATYGAQWSIARRACFLVINAEIGLVGREVELVAERFADRA